MSEETDDDYYECIYCHVRTSRNDVIFACDGNGDNVPVCLECSDETFTCELCGDVCCREILQNVNGFDGGEPIQIGVCEPCADNEVDVCESCGELYDRECTNLVKRFDGEEVIVCDTCKIIEYKYYIREYFKKLPYMNHITLSKVVRLGSKSQEMLQEIVDDNDTEYEDLKQYIKKTHYIILKVKNGKYVAKARDIGIVLNEITEDTIHQLPSWYVKLYAQQFLSYIESCQNEKIVAHIINALESLYVSIGENKLLL